MALDLAVALFLERVGRFTRIALNADDRLRPEERARHVIRRGDPAARVEAPQLVGRWHAGAGLTSQSMSCSTS
jgi:hypothetical protein